MAELPKAVCVVLGDGKATADLTVVERNEFEGEESATLWHGQVTFVDRCSDMCSVDLSLVERLAEALGYVRADAT